MAIDKEKSIEGRTAFGSAIHAIRESEGLTCEELGNLIGVTRQTINKVENGKYSVGSETLWMIADALGYEWKLTKK